MVITEKSTNNYRLIESCFSLKKPTVLAGLKVSDLRKNEEVLTHRDRLKVDHLFYLPVQQGHI